MVYRLGDQRLLSRPYGNSKRAILYVASVSSDAELRDEALLAELLEAEPEATLYTASCGFWTGSAASDTIRYIWSVKDGDRFRRLLQPSCRAGYNR